MWTRPWRQRDCQSGLGDPDQGGTPILSGYLPVDIPPGESSGFWGNDFSDFDTPGSYEIFGLADFLDEIQERYDVRKLVPGLVQHYDNALQETSRL